ncbi:PIG-L family deacetylase [Achromobacter sp.]|uniref:PIG-L family deacetylase n=1 Tax=Achromobacter sp. TaxID=134375 RepID=UPI0028A78976|nr:PIG-L family deacetylase [Achromobacter sp.]
MLREGRLIAVSPYFNDAVVSCAGVLAARPDCTVLTVFSGMPLGAGDLSESDRLAGFNNGRDAVRARQSGSERALALLRAGAAQMDLLDGQYLQSGEEGRLTGALAAALSALRPRVILMPLGLCISGGTRVSDACLTIRALFQRVDWVAYEEMCEDEPGIVQTRLAALLRRRILATPVSIPPETDAGLSRQRAIQARSSLATLDERVRATQPDAPPERYWRLSWRRERNP